MCVVCVVNDSVVNYLRQAIMYYSIQSYTKLFEEGFVFLSLNNGKIFWDSKVE